MAAEIERRYFDVVPRLGLMGIGLMADEKRQIIAIGGGGIYRESENLALGRDIF